MIGALIGDIVGSVYEFNNIKTKEFPLLGTNSHFTDDSVMTLAVAEIMQKGYMTNSGKITATCSFCSEKYVFDTDELLKH